MGKVTQKFFVYLNSKEYLVTLEGVEYGKMMIQLVYGLILECKTKKELGIALDFWTTEISIVEINLQISNINSLTKSKWRRPGLFTTAWLSNQVVCKKKLSKEFISLLFFL